MDDGSVERATKRESGLLSSLFPWRGLSIVTRRSSLRISSRQLGSDVSVCGGSFPNYSGLHPLPPSSRIYASVDSPHNQV
ncbi:hypothetical protein RHSIM_Rhsim12G0114700 [Rhododendron simsii]|uniref:Uncharacterized protein n=1 Tax=Rhododendron simsii TaxID=118357 RepID=A0A834G547_RHOSS|nr:hypothetical protein RHSIM_Rhsim12G0114700 [Rhododendron simsii]